VAKEIQLEETEGAPDNEQCGDILHSQKEDTRNKTSGVMSESEVESALTDFEDMRCVRVPLAFSPSDIRNLDFQPEHDWPKTIGKDACNSRRRFCYVSTSCIILWPQPDGCDHRLRATLRYLYTNDIEFALPGRSKTRENGENCSESSRSPLPSPKSVYRLATKVG
jgi:hypothetical protein